MNNIYLAQKIKEECKIKKIPISKLLVECNIRKSLIYDLEKRNYTPSVAIIEQIADYFDCSVDYLLGRTESPKLNNSNSINQQHINGNATANIRNEIPVKSDGTQELVEMIDKLNLVQKSEIVLKINEMQKDENQT